MAHSGKMPVVPATLSQPPPPRRWFQFSLKRLLLAVACFAVASAAATGVTDDGRVAIFFGLPIVATTATGAGIGSLLGRFWRGAAIAFAISVYSALAFWLWLTHAMPR